MTDNKPLSKEEIENIVIDTMIEYGPDSHCDGYEKITDFIIEWAKQNAINFAKFINGEGWVMYDEPDRWICPTESKRVITTEQLYEEYEEYKNKHH